VAGALPRRRRRAPPSRTAGVSNRDGIRIEPLYQRAPGREHSLRVDPRQPWIVTQRVDDPDVERAGAQVAEDLAQGATGLSLVFEGAPNAFGYGLPADAATLERLLKQVPLNQTHLRIDAHPWSRPMADWLVAAGQLARGPGPGISLSFGHRPGGVLRRNRTSAHVARGACRLPCRKSAGAFLRHGHSGTLLEATGAL